MWAKGPHPCWKVQKALDESGMSYEVVKHPPFPRGKRTDYIKLTGQNLLPAIELDDGTIIHRESKEMVAMIGTGQLTSQTGA
jgi:glutathione S-transferase